MRCFRLVDEAYLNSAFSGEGSQRYGGRWNSPGVAVVYTAEFLSLAQLELLVHLEAEDVLLKNWSYFAVEVGDDVILRLESWTDVPTDFFAWPAPTSTRDIGDGWFDDALSVALSVPSALTPGERNLLLNPTHGGYAAGVSVGAPEPLAFDRRLPSKPIFDRPGITDAPEASNTGLSEDGDDTPVPDDAENRKIRQARQFSKMVEAIDKKKDAVNALSESLRTFVQDAVPPDDNRSLVEAFNTLTDDDATNCINNAFKKLCQRNNTTGAADIGGFVEAWLPVVYEHHDRIPKIRSELADPDTATVTVPTRLPVATEITMAEAEEGLARLELSARNALVSRYDLGALASRGSMRMARSSSANSMSS